MSEIVLLTLSGRGGNPSLAPHLHSVFLISEWGGGESTAAYRSTTLSWAPKPFMTAEKSGFGTEVTAHAYQADKPIF